MINMKESIALNSSPLRLLICIIVCCTYLQMQAEVLVLRSGTTIEGEILLQNNDVIVIQTQDGSRYQYPTSEVEAVRKGFPDKELATTEKQVTPTRKKASLRIELSEGAAYLPAVGFGEYTDIGIQIGSHQIMNRRVFVGGGIGLRATVIDKHSYLFLPLQVTASIPFTERTHAPYIGMTLGYGFALKGASQGGITAGVRAGWQYNINNQMCLTLGADVGWQQARVSVSEEIEANTYTYVTNRNIVTFGIQLGLQF